MWLDALLIAAAIAHVVAVLLLGFEGSTRRVPKWVACAMVLAAALTVTFWATGRLVTSAVTAAAVGAVSAVAVSRLRRFSAGGALLLGSFMLLGPALLVWTTHFVAAAEVSTTTRVLLLAPVPLLLLFLPAVWTRTFENVEPLIRRSWTRPQRPRKVARGVQEPRVCIHVPAHAEPPEVVIATLDSLAQLDYSNYEVLVIDNNTTEPGLWLPVEEHCHRLGPRFQFIHVEGLQGAKAGALNFALDHTDPSAELIAVVDADYQVQPEFLAEMVGHFEDPSIGFVQSPHAYRSAETAYLKACDWEYAVFFATGMVSRNERNAGITVGTMCIIRREALERAGRWSTWCLTEDSELAVRVHAAGYGSVYINEVYGRGLIPDTFAGYRKQRFRWSYGPVTEFYAHWRLHIPGPWRTPSALTVAQRLHHATHGLYGIATGLALPMLPYGVAVATWMIARDEELPLRLPLWVALTAMLLSGLVLQWLTFRRLLGARLIDWLRASLATAALAHVVTVANLTALLGRTMPWQRTSKFRTRSTRLGAVRGATSETILGVTCLGIAVFLAAQSTSGLVTMLAIGLTLRGLQYLAAPALALLADRNLRQQAEAGLLRPVAVQRAVSARSA